MIRVLVPTVGTEPRLRRRAASRHAARFLFAHGGRASWPKVPSARGNCNWLLGVFCQEINPFFFVSSNKKNFFDHRLAPTLRSSLLPAIAHFPKKETRRTDAHTRTQMEC